MANERADAPRHTDVTEILPQGSSYPEAFNADELAPGTLLGEYVVDRVLGSGGAGIVYAAHHHHTGRSVAVKQLRSELLTYETMLTRFVREAEASTKIGHPNIVEILAFGGVQEQRPYYVMELLDGQDLRKTSDAEGRFSPRAALEVIAPVCAALQAAHDAGIVHRDIKASNIMVCDVNGERQIKLLDFGIAKMLYREQDGKGLTEPGTMMGTAHNMAPEQVRAEPVDGRADIYALGVVLFQLLTGQYPFSGSDPRQIALMHLQTPAPRPSTFAPLSPAIDAVVMRCLEKAPERRFQTANELLSALRAAVEDSPADAKDEATRGLGLLFEANGPDGEELTDELFEDISAVLDTVEMALLERGYQLPLRGSNSLLGVRVLDERAQLADERADAESLARELLQTLSQRDFAHPDARISASLEVAEVSQRGSEVTGGALLKTSEWAERCKLS